jgi:hypothetical protein
VAGRFANSDRQIATLAYHPDRVQALFKLRREPPLARILYRAYLADQSYGPKIGIVSGPLATKQR